jgi:uncharacterized membrane protein
MLKWLVRIGFVIAALVALFFVIGYFRDPATPVTATLEIAKPPQVVYDLIANAENLPKWSPEVTAVKIIRESPRRYR